jgi:NADH-quinone oxidoreductase subunit M
MALNDVGMNGAVIHMLNHGLTTGALFACVGVLYERYHTRSMDEIGGSWNRMPLFAFFFIFVALGSAALPGLNGFVGEFPILTGMFATSRLAASLAASGMILGAFYLILLLRRVVFGPLVEPAGHGHGHEELRPLGWHEIAGLTPLAVLILVIGVLPEPFFARIRPAVAITNHNLQVQRAAIEAEPPAAPIEPPPTVTMTPKPRVAAGPPTAH